LKNFEEWLTVRNEGIWDKSMSLLGVMNPQRYRDEYYKGKDDYVNSQKTQDKEIFAYQDVRIPDTFKVKKMIQGAEFSPEEIKEELDFWKAKGEELEKNRSYRRSRGMGSSILMPRISFVDHMIRGFVMKQKRITAPGTSSSFSSREGQQKEMEEFVLHWLRDTGAGRNYEIYKDDGGWPFYDAFYEKFGLDKKAAIKLLKQMKKKGLLIRRNDNSYGVNWRKPSDADLL